MRGLTLPAPCSLVCASAVLESLVVLLPMVFLCLKGALVSFYIYLLLWHFPGKRHWLAELS